MTRDQYSIAQSQFRPSELANPDRAAKLLNIRATQAMRQRENRAMEKQQRDAIRASTR